jgi:hypothetical protein
MLRAIGEAVDDENETLLTARMLALFEFTVKHPDVRVPWRTPIDMMEDATASAAAYTGVPSPTSSWDGEEESDDITLVHYVVRKGAYDDWYRDRTQWMLMAMSPTLLRRVPHDEQRDILCEALSSENETAVSMLISYFYVRLGRKAIFDGMRYAANALVFESFLDECAARRETRVKYLVEGPELDKDDRTALHRWALRWDENEDAFYFEGVITRVAEALIALGVPAGAVDARGCTAADYLRAITNSGDSGKDAADAAAVLESVTAVAA